MWLVKSLLALCLSAAFLSEKIGLPVSADSLFSSEDVRLLSIHDFVISYLLLNICFQTRSKRSTSSSDDKEVSDIKLAWVTDKQEVKITFANKNVDKILLAKSVLVDGDDVDDCLFTGALESDHDSKVKVNSVLLFSELLSFLTGDCGRLHGRGRDDRAYHQRPCSLRLHHPNPGQGSYHVLSLYFLSCFQADTYTYKKRDIPEHMKNETIDFLDDDVVDDDDDDPTPSGNANVVDWSQSKPQRWPTYPNLPKVDYHFTLYTVTMRIAHCAIEQSHHNLHPTVYMITTRLYNSRLK